MSAVAYWDRRYSDPEGIKHHSNQNLRIATDFCSYARHNKAFFDALSSEEIVEIGCGTGELAMMIKSVYNTCTYYATDFSPAAVKTAQSRWPSVNYWKFDVLKDRPFRSFDLAIASNTLEHFTEPHEAIKKMLQLAPKAIIIVPYRQPVTDGYDEEGGPGHVFEFAEESFDDYQVHASFTFETRGWDFSSAGEVPLQLAVLISE